MVMIMNMNMAMMVMLIFDAKSYGGLFRAQIRELPSTLSTTMIMIMNMVMVVMKFIFESSGFK